MYSKEDFESELESRLNEFYHQSNISLEKLQSAIFHFTIHFCATKYNLKGA